MAIKAQISISNLRSPKVKICGITDIETALFCVEQGVDYLGFVLSMSDTPRYLTSEQACSLISQLKAQSSKLMAKLVGVFVDEPADVVDAAAKNCRFDIVQLHGSESPEYCQHFRDEGYKVWKTFRLPAADDGNVSTTEITENTDIISRIQTYFGSVDAMHFDAYCKKRSGGGFGKTFDWDLAIELKKSVQREAHRVLLVMAGGLRVDNVLEAIKVVQPDIVDVSSGVERIAGVKDRDLIREFLVSIRSSY